MPKEQTAIQKAIQQALPASCSIYVKIGTRSWSGSGFHVGDGHVVTASHVAPPEGKNRAEIHITFDKKIYYPCDILISDPNIDTAILMVKGDYANVPTVSLGSSDNVQVGEEIAVIGSPENWHDTISVGVISNINQSMGDVAPSEAWNNIILIDAKILQGVSGGMVIGTDSLVIGLVMGVVGTQAQMGQGENAATPSNKILGLLKSIKHNLKNPYNFTQ